MRDRTWSRAGFALLLCLGIGMGTQCSRDERPVILIGDSITAGACGESPCVGFAELYAEYDPSSVTAGCGLTTSLSWIQHRGPPVVAAQCRQSLVRRGADPQRALVAPHVPARAAFVLLGTNDALFGGAGSGPVAAPDFEEHLRVLVRELRALGVERVVLVKPPYVNLDRPLLNARIDAYALVIDELCADEPAVLCGPDLREVLLSEHHGRDPVHPNQAGHRAIADAYIEFARSAGL